MHRSGGRNDPIASRPGLRLAAPAGAAARPGGPTSIGPPSSRRPRASSSRSSTSTRPAGRARRRAGTSRRSRCATARATAGTCSSSFRWGVGRATSRPTGSRRAAKAAAPRRCGPGEARRRRRLAGGRLRPRAAARRGARGARRGRLLPRRDVRGPAGQGGRALSPARDGERLLRSALGQPQNLIFVRDARARRGTLFTIGAYRDLKHYAEGGDVPEAKQEEAARAAGFDGAEGDRSLPPNADRAAPRHPRGRDQVTGQSPVFPKGERRPGGHPERSEGSRDRRAVRAIKSGIPRCAPRDDERGRLVAGSPPVSSRSVRSARLLLGGVPLVRLEQALDREKRRPDLARVDAPGVRAAVVDPAPPLHPEQQRGRRGRPQARPARREPSHSTPTDGLTSLESLPSSRCRRPAGRKRSKRTELPVGRPDGIVDARVRVVELEDLLGLAAVERRDPELLVADDVHDARTVRREGHVRAAGDLAERARARRPSSGDAHRARSRRRPGRRRRSPSAVQRRKWPSDADVASAPAAPSRPRP